MSEKNTREQIFETAVCLFAQRGYHGTSMREIARAVGIKESSIYNHFNGKSSIMQAILDFQLKTFKNLFIPVEDVERFADQFDDPVSFWLAGVQQIESNLPPLTETIEGILHNEIFLDEQCRKFVLVHLFTSQKKLCRMLLELLNRRNLIRDHDFECVAEQYVSMVHGMRIEGRLQKLEGVAPSEIQKRILSRIAGFIELLR